VYGVVCDPVDWARTSSSSAFSTVWAAPLSGAATIPSSGVTVAYPSTTRAASVSAANSRAGPWNSMRRSPDRMSDEATQNSPYGARSASRTPRTSAMGTFGTLRLSTRGRSAPATVQSSAGTASRAAVSQWYSAVSLHLMLTARAGTPSPAAVSAAPTVPECRTRWPVLAPGLIPDATTSGRSPKAPRQARYTAVAGGRSSVSTRTSGTSGKRRSATGIGSDACSGPIDAPAPLRSDAGATTNTS
jgi:hypothetical protein